MRRILFALALFACSLPAGAATRQCSTALVNANLCSATDHVLLYFSVPPAAQPRLVSALSSLANWQADVPCAADRVVDEDGALVVAGHGDGTCSQATDGQQVPNPQTRAQAADRYLLRTLRKMIAAHETATNREAVPEAEEPEIVEP